MDAGKMFVASEGERAVEYSSPGFADARRARLERLALHGWISRYPVRTEREPFQASVRVRSRRSGPLARRRTCRAGVFERSDRLRAARSGSGQARSAATCASTGSRSASIRAADIARPASRRRRIETGLTA